MVEKLLTFGLERECSMFLSAAWQTVRNLYWAIFVFFFFFFLQMMYLQKQVHTSPKELCGAVFRVPTCCSWGKINVEQAKGRNAFKAPLIELDGLQSQRQSLNKARAGEILRCASHVHIIKPAALAHGSTVPMHISETVGIIWESCLEGAPPPPPPPTQPSFKMKVPWLSMKGKCSHAEAHWAGHWTGEHSSVIQFDLNPICWLRVSEYRRRGRNGRGGKLGKSDVEEWEAKWWATVGGVKGSLICWRGLNFVDWASKMSHYTLPVQTGGALASHLFGAYDDM